MEKGKLTPIVIKAKSGDKTALNTLFTENYNSVYFFALKTVKDETLAADITQETFVTIFQNLDTLNDPVAYPAWSRQITYRHCLQYLKKQNRETTVDENEDGSTIFDTIEEDRTEFIPDEQLDKEDFKKTILNIVDSLPEEQRTSVILYYYDELSVKQIAEIQGVTEGTVKSRLNYARKTIKSAVETYEKKNNVKLHSVGVLPLLLWLFGTDAKACTLPTATATTIASGVSTATGTTISLSKTVQISSKLLGALWQKIVAGLVAVAIVTGGTVAVVNIVNKQDTQVPQDKGQLETFQKPPVKENVESETPIIVTGWRGFGEATHKPYVSQKNEFILTTEQMDETYLKGELTISVLEGSSYQKLFEIDIEGTGVKEDTQTMYTCSISYDEELKDTIEKYFIDVPNHNELTLRYHFKTESFGLYFGEYNVAEDANMAGFNALLRKSDIVK